MMLHLASKSPRRRELLGRLGLEFGVLDLDVPEQREPGEGPADYVRRVAREKAGAGLLRVVDEIGRAHVCTPVTNAQLVCRLLLEKKNNTPVPPRIYVRRLL